MSVISKFKCTAVSTPGESGSVQVELNAITGTKSEENKAFWQATPSGSISLSITNPDAFNQFEAGEEYYVTFEKA